MAGNHGGVMGVLMGISWNFMGVDRDLVV